MSGTCFVKLFDNLQFKKVFQSISHFAPGHETAPEKLYRLKPRPIFLEQTWGTKPNRDTGDEKSFVQISHQVRANPSLAHFAQPDTVNSPFVVQL